MNKMIPSEIIQADENGNAVIGKNLEVDGTIRVNAGFKPVSTYQFTATKDGESGSYILADYGNYQGHLEHILGVYDENNQYSIVGFGIFLIQGQKVDYIYLIGFSGLDGGAEILSFSDSDKILSSVGIATTA